MGKQNRYVKEELSLKKFYASHGVMGRKKSYALGLSLVLVVLMSVLVIGAVPTLCDRDDPTFNLEQCIAAQNGKPLGELTGLDEETISDLISRAAQHGDFSPEEQKLIRDAINSEDLDSKERLSVLKGLSKAQTGENANGNAVSQVLGEKYDIAEGSLDDIESVDYVASGGEGEVARYEFKKGDEKLVIPLENLPDGVDEVRLSTEGDKKAVVYESADGGERKNKLIISDESYAQKQEGSERWRLEDISPGAGEFDSDTEVSVSFPTSKGKAGEVKVDDGSVVTSGEAGVRIHKKGEGESEGKRVDLSSNLKDGEDAQAVVDMVDGDTIKLKQAKGENGAVISLTDDKETVKMSFKGDGSSEQQLDVKLFGDEFESGDGKELSFAITREDDVVQYDVNGDISEFEGELQIEGLTGAVEDGSKISTKGDNSFTEWDDVASTDKLTLSNGNVATRATTRNPAVNGGGAQSQDFGGFAKHDDPINGVKYGNVYTAKTPDGKTEYFVSNDGQRFYNYDETQFKMGETTGIRRGQVYDSSGNLVNQPVYGPTGGCRGGVCNTNGGYYNQGPGTCSGPGCGQRGLQQAFQYQPWQPARNILRAGGNVIANSRQRRIQRGGWYLGKAVSGNANWNYQPLQPVRNTIRLFHNRQPVRSFFRNRRPVRRLAVGLWRVRPGLFFPR